MNLIESERRDRERIKAEAFTEQQLAEALTDFDKFAALVEVIAKDNKRVRFVPNYIQRLRTAHRTARDIVLKARQQGLTTIEQVRDLFYFLTVPGARVVLVCQSVTGDKPLKDLAQNFRVMLDALKRAGMKLDFTTEAIGEWSLADRDASLKIIVAGASEASASKKGRAGTISRLHITECAFYEYADSTLNALLECVPGEQFGSEIVIESTANGASGFFYRLCQQAIDKAGAYKFQFFPWFDTEEYSTPLAPGERIRPENEREQLLVTEGVTQAQLKWYRGKIADKGQDMTDQEYPSDPVNCFLLSGRQFFDAGTTTLLIGRTTPSVETRERDRISIWRAPEPGARYLISVDTSEGTGLDASAAIVRNVDTAELCAVLHGQYTPGQLAESTARLGWEYNEALIAVERNNHGNSVLETYTRLRDENDVLKPYTAIYYAPDEKAGWNNTSVTRPVVLDGLEDAHRKGHWTTPCLATLKQFRNFIVSKTGRPEGAPGEHDDLVLAEAINWSVRQTMPRIVHAAPPKIKTYESPLAGW